MEKVPLRDIFSASTGFLLLFVVRWIARSSVPFAQICDSVLLATSSSSCASSWTTTRSWRLKKKHVPHVRRHMCPAQLPRHVSVLLCVLPGVPDTCPFSCVFLPRLPRPWQKKSFFWREGRWPQMLSTQDDFCAVLYTVFGGDSWCF